MIDYAVQKYGKKVKFLTFHEAQARLDENLLSGHPLRAPNGQDNGVRLLDLNNDGYIDVMIGNNKVQEARLWSPKENKWISSKLPSFLDIGRDGECFGILQVNGFPSCVRRSCDKA